MSVGGKNFNRSFARVSPVFVSLAFALLCPVVTAPVFAAGTAGVKRQAAQAQLARAEEQRAILNSKPANKRTLAEYRQAVSSYRRVYLITPRAAEVPDALLAVAELYTEMGDRFGRSYYQSAVDSYQFLVHEYPKSRYCQDSALRIARLEKEQLGDTALATKNYEDFVKKYPRSPRRREVEEALAELALLRNSDADAPAAESPLPFAGEEALPKTPEYTTQTGIPRVRRITTSAAVDSTRVTIDLEDSVQYTSARINNPDRIFFDLHAARLTPEIAKGSIQVEGDLLTDVRVAQNQAGVVRVVFSVNGVKDYTASLSNNPPRLIIDLYGTTAALRAAKSKRAKEQEDSDDEDASTAASPENKAAMQHVAAKNSRSKPLKASNGKPDLPQAPVAPQPTRDGQATLTRALGLKIGRIVVDPGHGGHDTGTIGPTGLMEKDLCLDVALRLGKIIAQRLPGADIVYTRSDDTFIPLEERTNIANQAKADLFISIHANSSHDQDARGIETYYLNLKGSPEAMEVAARENASSQEGVHDLEDLVKKIARNEKIDESREFAEDIQDSLAKRIQKSARTVRNRGVRKAPFVVLIGADMPSILTEVSFLSNPSDEKLLKKPEYRQRVAEGLYQGIASYLQSLNSVTLNLPGRTAPARPAAVASVEQSRNQQ
ncbi:MAG TPA: N-acetylmuramoyl-L-alanine amidase [Candidatus Acidoferrum sp.]|nr:N-acetylmuramoyl-L-alanine amidase [Candidatus Acidoferrum sp.]